MIRILATGFAACSLAACVSVLPEPKVPQGLYRFAPVETVYDLDASVIIREPEASRLVAGRAIAAEDSAGALRLVPNVEWTDSSTRLMQMAMLDALEGQGAGRAVPLDDGNQPVHCFPISSSYWASRARFAGRRRAARRPAPEGR